jgi:hypothetical protein
LRKPGKTPKYVKPYFIGVTLFLVLKTDMSVSNCIHTSLFYAYTR